MGGWPAAVIAPEGAAPPLSPSWRLGCSIHMCFCCLASGPFLAPFHLLPPTSPCLLRTGTPDGPLTISAHLQPGKSGRTVGPMGRLPGHPLERSTWHLPCAKNIPEDRGRCAWEEGQGIPSPHLWNISLNGLNQTVALGKVSFSRWQPTGCRVTPPSHFQILLLGRSQPQGPWAGVWKVRVGKRGPGDTKEWVREPERLASGLGVGKAPSPGRTWREVPEEPGRRESILKLAP